MVEGRGFKQRNPAYRMEIHESAKDEATLCEDDGHIFLDQFLPV